MPLKHLKPSKKLLILSVFKNASSVLFKPDLILADACRLILKFARYL